ncbi:Strongly-conserved Zn-finger binding protein (TFIIIA) [Linnemannia elongata]|nr:Strongly-conserved Zn-finger binding protein (TFIIIA) [Linnemannia elongata]
MKRRKLDLDKPTTDDRSDHQDGFDSEEHQAEPIYPTSNASLEGRTGPSCSLAAKGPLLSRTKSFVCQYPGCEKAYTKPSRLVEHELVHSGERPFKCQEPTCNASFRREAHLATHHKSQHGGARDFICPQPGCTSAFHTQDKLAHRLAEEIRTARPYACTWEGCLKRFTKHQKLKAHICMAHEGRKPYPCPAEGCDKSYQTPSKLRKHSLQHSQTKRYACAYPGCGEYFIKWSLLQKHTKIDHKTTQCDICGKAILKRNLSAHIKIHDVSRPEVPCTVEGCQKVFSTERTLATHVKASHPSPSGPPQFKCEYEDCGQAFSFKHVLERHIHNRHTNPKMKRKKRSDALEFDVIDALAGFDDEDEVTKVPFACQVPGSSCNRRFTTEALLKRHLKSRAHATGEVTGLAVLRAMEQDENRAIQDMIALHLDASNSGRNSSCNSPNHCV